MSEDIVLRIIAQDQYSQELKEAKAAVDKMTDAEKKSALAAKEHSAQMQKMGNIAKGAALGGIAAVTAAMGDSIKETMDYNKSIRELAQNLALTTEETSRIVQTADDFTVSQEAVTTALQMAVKKGMKPNIDTLARMADLYNSISDPTERAAKLTEVFGRNWAALTPMLKEGGQAIREAAAAQDEALLVTEANSKATRELEINMDNLGDKVTALKMKVGNALIPVLNDAADAFGYLTEGVGAADEVENKYTQAIAILTVTQGANSKAVEEASKALTEYLRLRQSLGQTDNEKRIRAETAAIKEFTVNLVGSKDGMLAYADATRIANAANDDYKLATDALIVSTQILTRETLFKIAAEGLDATAALQVARAMGLVDEKTAAQVTSARAIKEQYDKGYISLLQYTEQLNALGVSIGLLPDLKVVTVELRTQTGGQAGRVGGEVDLNAGQQSGPQNATGANFIVPPGYNENYPIGMASSGERVQVTPVNQQTRNTTNSSVVINIGSISKDFTPRQAGDEILNKMRSRGLIA